jgi:hypothetical protein
VAFCKTLPRPAEAQPNTNINDYCECWVGTTENKWTRAEYDEWKTAQQRKAKLSPALAGTAHEAAEECVALTTHG